MEAISQEAQLQTDIAHSSTIFELIENLGRDLNLALDYF